MTPGQKSYVPHPIFGNKPIPSGFDIREKEIKKGLYQDESSFFKETAIPANLTKQDHGIFARLYYVDIEKQCRDCSKWFLFFALEQHHWFETLGFNVNARCVRCHPCRKNKQNRDQKIKRYHKLLTQSSYDRNAIEAFLDATMALATINLIKRPEKVLQKLNRLKQTDSLSSEIIEKRKELLRLCSI